MRPSSSNLSRAVLGLSAALTVAGQAGAVEHLHEVTSQVAVTQRNDTWAQLDASCVLDYRVVDPAGEIDGPHTGTFDFMLDAAGTGHSDRAMFADRLCHPGNGPLRIEDVHIRCTMAGGSQKSTATYSAGAHTHNPLTPSHGAKTYSETYLTVGFGQAETQCAPPPVPPKDPPPKVDPPPGDDDQDHDHGHRVPPGPNPPTPPPKRDPTFSGTKINPPACFANEAARKAFVDRVDLLILAWQATSAGGSTPREKAQNQADLNNAINDMKEGKYNALYKPICPPPATVPVARETGRPPDKTPGLLGRILSHVSIGFGVASSTSRRDQPSRGRDAPTSPPPPAPSRPDD